MDALRDRAIALLRAAGGTLSSAALTRGLFGGSGPSWAAILEQALAEPRFARLPPPADGWRLVEAQADEGVVALSIETTGHDPRRSALVHIAACRVVDGRPGPAFSTLVNPGRRLPGWLAERLGVGPDMGDDALPLAVALDQLAEFVGAATIVSFDAGWTLRFVNEQCRKAGRRPFTNRTRDLLPAAAALMGNTKPALAAVAAKLDLPVIRRHRGPAHAQLIARIAGRLEATDAAPTTDRLVDRVNEMPEAPGVYIFRAMDGEPLYIGKAKRLRQRVRSYLTHLADRDLGGLRAMAVTVEWQTTPDDLAAALLESELIATHQPRFNTHRRAAPAPAYLELSSDEPFPRLRRVGTPGAGRFGPFGSGTRAAREARLVATVFSLRTCARKVGVPRKTKPRPPCGLLQRGRCLGPCTGTVTEEEYGALVAKGRAFLAGDEQVALRELQTRAQAAAGRGDRAEVDRLRRLLRGLATRRSGDLLDLSYDPANVAILLPADAPARAYVVRGGLLCWCGPVEELTDDALASARLGEPGVRGGIIAQRWLSTNRSAARTVPLPPEAGVDEVLRRIAKAYT